MPTLSEQTLKDRLTRIFKDAGMVADMAQDAADMLVTAEMMGISTHGLAKVETYVQRLRDGGVDPLAEPSITRPAPALIKVDGQNGLGAAVALRATKAAMEAARDVGMGAAFVRASSHLGALAPQLLHAAEGGFACIFVTNTSPMIAPPGGKKAVIGNTPLGIALPDPAGEHVILDFAMSVVARSKVRTAAAKGEAIPPTWATDADGQPTTDAAAAMKGLMLAIGGDKGANLSLCLDLLAGGLSGAAILSEVPNANTDSKAVANVGHLFIVLDVKRLMTPEALASRLNDARRYLADNEPTDPNAIPRLPGKRALAQLAEARANGVTVSDAMMAKLDALLTN